MSTNENNKASLPAENHDVTNENTPHTGEESVDGNTKNRGSTPQKNVSFDEASSDNRKTQEQNGE